MALRTGIGRTALNRGKVHQNKAIGYCLPGGRPPIFAGIHDRGQKIIKDECC